MIKRILYAIPALFLLLTVIYFHGLYAQIVVTAVAALCIYEMMKAASGSARPFWVVGFVYAILTLPAYLWGGLAAIAALLTLGVLVVFVLLVLTGRNAQDGLITALPMVYPGMFLVFLLAIVSIPQVNLMRFMMIIAFAAAIITDTFAYFGGMLLGRHKLAPAISPKKTVEGALCGAVFGAGSVFALGALLQSSFGVSIHVLWYALLGFVLTVLTQIGDLAASLIKRRLGIKDYGYIMGEHGGALDRLDSVIFICPVVFAFYTIIAA